MTGERDRIDWKRGRGGREIAARCLVFTLLWGFVVFWAAVWYSAGRSAGAHPAHYDPIAWWSFAIAAVVPLLVGSLIVTLRIATGKL